MTERGRADRDTGASACFPEWAREQLLAAVTVADSVTAVPAGGAGRQPADTGGPPAGTGRPACGATAPGPAASGGRGPGPATCIRRPGTRPPAPGRPLASELYERWFAPALTAAGPPRALAGDYRRAHAAVGERLVDGLAVLDRADHLGADGWWRTWNTGWRPRPGRPRLVLSPQAHAVAEVVAVLTRALRDVGYLLACPTDPHRLTRSGAVVVYVRSLRALDRALLDELAPLLRADTPPLCLPLAPGAAVAEYPNNGMTFGEHRCHLLALALSRAGRRDPLAAIAEAFARNGVDPRTPYRSAR